MGLRFQPYLYGENLKNSVWNYGFQTRITGDWTDRLYSLYSESEFAPVVDWLNGPVGRYTLVPRRVVNARDATTDVLVLFEKPWDALRFALEWT